ncbi:hypothetical protein HYC85_000865 [Camellia sinensis]|uniref:CS domain-containing protein n=1 Tax=Camellia sinensis TaxID=4442 RepID=A0A7J7I578_CAMSI|nr:hypothetical protein HYC85_000865 [Camellia sinensis]
MAEKLAPEKRHGFFHGGQKVFEWDQTLEEVNMYVTLPPNVPKKLFYSKIQSKHVEVGIKGNPPYLNNSSCIVKLEVLVNYSSWVLELGILICRADINLCEFAFEVVVKLGFLVTTTEDDTLHITLQKRDKGQTWPSPILGEGQLDPYSVDVEQKRLMLQRFQEENPGFDFSQAQFTGNCPDPRTFMGGIRSD